MASLTILKGLPASGKTTYAKQLVDISCKRVNKDDLRMMIDNGKYSKSNEANVHHIMLDITRHYLARGYHVVWDNTNLNPKILKEAKKLVKDYEAPIEIVDFTDVPLETCIERDKLREVSVGEKVIRDMYNKYIKKDTK